MKKWTGWILAAALCVGMLAGCGGSDVTGGDTRVMIDGAASVALIPFVLDTAILSLGLGVFNLIPIPPLDGSKILAALLPDKQYRLLMRYERFGMLLIMLLVVFGALGGVMGTAISWLFDLFCRIVGLM